MDFSKIEEQIDKLIKLQDGWLDGEGKAPTVEAIMQAEDIIQELFFYSKILPEDCQTSLYPMLYPEGVQIEIDVTKDIGLTIEIGNDPKDCHLWLMDCRDLSKGSELEFERTDSLKTTQLVSRWLREELPKYLK